MRVAMMIGCVALALVAIGEAEGQGKKKKTPGKKLPALAFDAKLVKFVEKNSVPTKLYYAPSPEDAKKLGFKSGDHPVNARTKFTFVGPDGEKAFTQKNVLKDEEAKKHLAKDSKIRVQVSGVEVEEVRFGPDLKPQGIKRVR